MNEAMFNISQFNFSTSFQTCIHDSFRLKVKISSSFQRITQDEFEIYYTISNLILSFQIAQTSL